MQLFFSENIKDGIIILDEIESNHCLNVMRFKQGSDVSVVDGKGNFYKGIIAAVEKKKCYIEIKKTIQNFDKRSSYVHIAISPIKNHDRLEWFVEKVIEIGINEITFLNCTRTLRKTVRMNRILKIAKSAMKQTLKATLPKINPLINYNDFIRSSKNKNKFICHLKNEITNDIFSYKKDMIKNDKLCVLIGPEGDFTSDEIELAHNEKFKPLTLGKVK